MKMTQSMQQLQLLATLNCTLLITLILAILANQVDLAKADGWSYKDQQHWKCDATNMRQSPIDIETDKVVFKKDVSLNFVNYDQEVEFNLKNTHHSVSMEPIKTNELKPIIELNWVEGGNEFELQEIHFHWGDGVNKGSEHEINNVRAAAEMHMVHYRKGLSKEDIGSIENSVVVIGVLIESDQMDHNKLEPLVAAASKVNGTDSQSKCDHPEHLINLLPDNTASFFTYNGSLTTPPCYEVVTWVIMAQPVYLSQSSLIELSQFKRVGDSKTAESIGPNYRDIQPLLDRPVYSSYDLRSAIPATKPTDTHLKSKGLFEFRKALKQYVPEVKSRLGWRLVSAVTRATQFFSRSPSTTPTSAPEPNTLVEEPTPVVSQEITSPPPPPPPPSG